MGATHPDLLQLGAPPQTHGNGGRWKGGRDGRGEGRNVREWEGWKGIGEERGGTDVIYKINPESCKHFLFFYAE
jgi:hypothetical protein